MDQAVSAALRPQNGSGVAKRMPGGITDPSETAGPAYNLRGRARRAGSDLLRSRGAAAFACGGRVPEPVEASIESVIERSIAGDQTSWALLVRRCEPVLTRQMWRFSRDRGVCQELIQDVLVELYGALPRYRQRGVPFEHWLRRIATRVGYRYWKRQRRQRAVGAIEEGQRLVSQAAGPLEEMEASDAARLLHELLARLAPADRLVLTLTYFEECDAEAIAQQTGWNRGVIRMRLVRARRRLRQLVESSGVARSLEVADGQRAMDSVARPASPA